MAHDFLTLIRMGRSTPPFRGAVEGLALSVLARFRGVGGRIGIGCRRVSRAGAARRLELREDHHTSELAIMITGKK